jgi:maspardin
MSGEKGDGFKLFRSWVPLQRMNVDYFGAERVWKYYDWGPKDVAPLICIPGVSGTAESFFKQFLSLSPKGFRVVAVSQSN